MLSNNLDKIIAAQLYGFKKFNCWLVKLEEVFPVCHYYICRHQFICILLFRKTYFSISSK